MNLNCYENTTIKNNSLPASWQRQEDLDGLSDFLQQNWEQRAIFYDDREISGAQQFLSFVGQKGIKTRNYIGTIVYNGEQLNIYPKVFRTDSSDQDTEHLNPRHLMKNLVRWLAYCSRTDYPFIHISGDLEDADDLKELFITLYIGYVRSALERGGFYQYVDETDDCGSIKGRLDIRDYLTRKLPGGKGSRFQCVYSKFEFDNQVNRIMKYTCRQLYDITSKRNQKHLRDILAKLDAVSLVPCTPADCSRIRLSKLHENYRIIISMSKMFLLNQLSDCSMDLNESFCFLFPAEILFEGFIGGFIQETVRDYGGTVRLQQSDMHLIEDVIYEGESLGAAFTMRHDILVEIEGNVFILDTKYKQISRFEGNPDDVMKTVAQEPKQTDIYQMCEYARKRDIQDVYLLYPMFRYEEKEPSFPVGISRSRQGDIHIHFIRLPFVFEEDEAHTTQMLREVILTVFGLRKPKTITVVAAIITDGHRIFATQRGYGAFKDGWEFPGGKIESGETPEQALAREIREELDTEIEVGELFDTVEYDYPDFHLTMYCFLCTVKSGGLILKEHEDARWLTRETLDSVDWLPADEGLIDRLRSDEDIWQQDSHF